MAGGQECGGELLHGDGCCSCGEGGGDAVAEYRRFGWLHAVMVPRRSPGEGPPAVPGGRVTGGLVAGGRPSLIAGRACRRPPSSRCEAGAVVVRGGRRGGESEPSFAGSWRGLANRLPSLPEMAYAQLNAGEAGWGGGWGKLPRISASPQPLPRHSPPISSVSSASSARCSMAAASRAREIIWLPLYFRGSAPNGLRACTRSDADHDR